MNENFNYELKRIGEISSISGISIEQLLDYIAKLNNVYNCNFDDGYNLNQGLLESKEEIIQEYNYDTTDQLKKQIKYSKNPLEIKMLNRQLNKIYKTIKGR